MTTKLSTKGQVVLPRAIRQKLGLQPGTPFACLVRENDIVLRPLARPSGKARILTSRTTGLPVIVPPRGTPVLTSAVVKAALADFP
jgi:AbrB family looped-hinge helix DNA binding protein